MTRTFLRSSAAVLMLFLSLFTTAQVNEGGMPFTYQNNKINWHLPIAAMPSFDLEPMLAEDAIVNAEKSAPYRFGKNFEVNYNLDNAGQWHNLPGGGRLWLFSVISDGALSINLTFDQFLMPEGGRMYIYNTDYTQVLGAYTSANNAPDLTFATYPVPGEQVIIEYYEPAEHINEGIVQLQRVTHAYRDIEKAARDIGDSGTCNNNVVCPEGNPWQDEINSVAMVVVGSNGICTGALVNNTANDGHPYFLTANHCTSGGVTNWVFRFNWQSTTCVGNNVGTYQTVNGSQLLASGTSADYCLLRINNGNPIPTAYNPYYAGWDASGTNPSSQVDIHHPSGDLKKISFDNQAAGTATYGGATCWRIFNWEDGTTEPGSSGSPLFDQNHRVIGQLYGGQATCSNNVNDYYGKFDVTYPNVCQWLAPGCNTTILDGYDPTTPTANLDVQLLSINQPTGILCAATVNPQITVRNAGINTLTSFTIQYNIDGAANQTQLWTGSLASGNTVNVSLPAATPAAGAHTYNVNLINPNGGVDQNNANNSGSSSFTTIANPQTVTLTLLTDNYPAETSWNITTTGGTVLYSGGSYASTQTTFTETLCMGAGCYILNVFDSFGDGMQFQGVVGNYTLTDENGTVLAQMVAGGNFGSQATHNFCLTASGIDGCTNAGACNFNPAATNDDGSCEFTSCAGCTNVGACNYDNTATIDDGSCEFVSCAGCTNVGACNYDNTATIDDGSCILPTTYYADTDSDGFGDAASSTSSCIAPFGFVTNSSDCDDTRGDVYPGAPGTAEGIDNNCNGSIDPSEELAPACLGDFNVDGQRNVSDLLMLLADFGCTSNCGTDIDGNGNVNASDFLVFLGLFNTTCN